MLNLVVTIIFKIIGIIAGVILTPVVAVLKPIFDILGFTSFVPYILDFIDTALTYFSFFAICLHIPLAPLLLVVSICGVLLTFTITIRAYLLIQSVYQAFKGNTGGRKIGFDTSSNN